jgi:HEPN domain-containing protein
MNQAITNWVKSSEYDLTTAEVMYRGGRYIYVIFMCHLAVEKMLKALVADKINKIPPKTHHLLYLAKLAAIEIPAIHKEIIMHLNEASVPTRYPTDISKLSLQYNRKAAGKYLKKTKALLPWLKGMVP